jgi:hypothetical protein
MAQRDGVGTESRWIVVKRKRWELADRYMSWQ